MIGAEDLVPLYGFCLAASAFPALSQVFLVTAEQTLPEDISC